MDLRQTPIPRAQDRMQRSIGTSSRSAVIFLGGFALVQRVIHSPFGEILNAIRENEARAESLGYKVSWF
jgi:ABC-type branched-subunit amino acid transport system permease subunit